MKIDLHCHTNHTRGIFNSNMKPKNIIKMAKRRRLGGIAITDDFTLNGYNKVRMENKDRDFLVVPGFEVQCHEIEEVLILGMEYVPKTKNILELIDEVKENDAVCIVPHPFTLLPILRYKKSLNELRMFDGIEVLNSFDLGVYTELADKVADVFKLGKTAGSDAHSLRNVGLAYTICDNPIKDIKKRRTKIGGLESPWSYKFSNIIDFFDSSSI